MHNRIYRLFILVSLLFIGQLGFSQSSKDMYSPDARLYEAFGKDRIEFLKQNNPDLIMYYNFYLDNAFVLVQHPTDKIQGIVKNCPMLEVNNPSFAMDKPDMTKGTKSINILKYKYQIDPNKATTYRLDNSGIVIVFYPAKTITEKYNKARNL
jgi:hypothetical protein